MAPNDALRISFFEECEDLLARMGEGLGDMAQSLDRSDPETIHAVFRAVHSIKGGAGAFALKSLVEFAHVFETVLDLMRSGEMAVEAAPLHTMRRGHDVLSDLVAAARTGGDDPPQMATVLLELDALSDGSSDSAQEPFDFQPQTIDIFALPEPAAAIPDRARISVRFQPTPALYAAGHEPAALLRGLEELGDLTVRARIERVPVLTALDLAAPNIFWDADLLTSAATDEVVAIFEFVGDLATLDITTQPAAAEEALERPETAQVPAAPPPVTAPDPGPTNLGPSDSSPTNSGPTDGGQPDRGPTDSGPTDRAVTAFPVISTIRVNTDRVDRLVNQIGELVIAEAMLSQAMTNAGLRDDGDIVSSLEGIRQLAANIQESVMSIRAQPIKPVFQRMDRITREASDATGKRARLITTGDTTEVDKTVIERLVDPLTHMIRNAIDHGLETADRRAAAGKPAEGQIRLSAAHRSGRVIIEVADDGAGIDRPRVRQIAEQRGLVAPGAQLQPADIDNLLFLPGFSSKAEVSALSGRGVGLDVVRREIQSLGGRVSITSTPGQGTTFTIALPLTLAVLEGMLIGVGEETMVLPLSCILETMRPTQTQIHRLGRSARLVATRGEMVPILDLCDAFGFQPAQDQSQSVLILVECETGQRAALEVRHIFDQRQVVIKSLEDNYGSVPGISAATILGDGRIALIVDPEELVRHATADTLSFRQAANG